MRHLDAEHRRRAESHRRQPARRDERAGHGDRKLLADAVLVPADVGDDEAVFGHGLAQLAEDPLGPHRELIRAPLMIPVRRRTPCRPRAISSRRRPRSRWLLPRAAVGERAERQLRVGDDAELGRVVAADLRRVGVDVDQPRRRNREREARIPRARVRFGEPRADGDDQIGGRGTCRWRSACPRSRSGRAAAGDPRAGSPCPSACARPAPRALRRARPAPRSRAPTARRRRRRAPAARPRERIDDARRRSPRRASAATSAPAPAETRRPARSAEKMSIGTSTSTGPGPSGLREMERALDDARQILDAIDAVDALAERPVDLELVGVLVQVDFLMRVPAVVVRRHVAGDHHHRDRIERRVGDAGAGVGQARARDASAARPACRDARA